MSAKEEKTVKRLLLISGVSGSGKTTIIKELTKRNEKYVLVKSVTTRIKRDNDDFYYHVNRDEFETFSGGYLEKVCYCGNWYGTPVTEVEKIWRESNNIPVLDVDINGFIQIRSWAMNNDVQVSSIFIISPATEIFNRLRNRGTESIQDIIIRMIRAVKEVKMLEYVPYGVIIENQSFDQAIKEILDYALKNEHDKLCEKEKILIKGFIKEMENIISECYRGLDSEVQTDTNFALEKASFALVCDPLLREAGNLIIKTGKTSLGFIQHSFKIGFFRALFILQQLEDIGLLSPNIEEREILLTVEKFEKICDGLL